jgi:TRAP-type transport system small permease protein
MKSAIQRLLDAVEKIFLAVSSGAILVIMFITTFDLLARKVFDYSIPSLYEFTEDYLMVSLVFLSISYVYVLGGHVRVTLLEPYFPRGIKKPLELFLKSLGLIFFILITLKGWDVTVRAYQFGEVSSSVLAYPLAPAFFLVPLGSALVCVRIFQSLFTSWETAGGHEAPHAD